MGEFCTEEDFVETIRKVDSKIDLVYNFTKARALF